MLLLLPLPLGVPRIPARFTLSLSRTVKFGGPSTTSDVGNFHRARGQEGEGGVGGLVPLISSNTSLGIVFRWQCFGIRAHRHRTHQLTKPGFWSLEKREKLGGMKKNGGKWGEMEKNGGKWVEMEEKGGKWGEMGGNGGGVGMGGKWGNSGHSTGDVGCEGLWRDVVEENGTKMGENGTKY